MTDNSKIEWTDATWNPVRGCTKVSAGCDNCYAMSVAHRFSGPGLAYEGLTRKLSGRAQWNGKIKLVPELLDKPLRWIKPRMIFVNSMSDLFHPDVPFEFIDKVFAVMSCTTRHTYQILTKRPERMLEYFTEYLTMDDVFDHPEQINALDVWPQWVAYREGKRGGYDNCGPAYPYENVWLGVSVEDQKTANERIPFLLKCPAAVRWISAEPLLDSIQLSKWLPGASECSQLCGWRGDYPNDERCHHCGWQGDSAGEFCPNCGRQDWSGVCPNCDDDTVTGHPDTTFLDWVITGGESGPRSRPAHPDWFRSLRDQCDVTDTPFFFKQWGEYAPNWLNDNDGNRIEGSKWMDRMGKKSAGRLLDGREWNEFPNPIRGEG